MKELPPGTNEPIALPQPLHEGPYFDFSGCINGIDFEPEWRRLCDELGAQHEDTLVAASWAAVVRGVDVAPEWLPRLQKAEAILWGRPSERLALGLNLASQGFSHWGLGEYVKAVENFALATAFLRTEDVHVVDLLRITEFAACSMRASDGALHALDLLEATKELTVEAFLEHDVVLAHVQLRAEILEQLQLEDAESLRQYRQGDAGIGASAAQGSLKALTDAAESHSARGDWPAAEECLSATVDQLLSSRQLSADDIEGYLRVVNRVLRAARADARRRSKTVPSSELSSRPPRA